MSASLAAQTLADLEKILAETKSRDGQLKEVFSLLVIFFCFQVTIFSLSQRITSLCNFIVSIKHRSDIQVVSGLYLKIVSWQSRFFVLDLRKYPILLTILIDSVKTGRPKMIAASLKMVSTLVSRGVFHEVCYTEPLFFCHFHLSFARLIDCYC